MTAPAPFPPLSLLVVDDDAETLRATSRLLSRAGYDVREAATGESALAAVRAARPDLVLLDVNLPDLLGYEVCRRIKAETRPSPPLVVMLSASMVSSERQSEGLETGADGYVTRPVPNRELLARVDAYARIARAERERDRVIAELREALAQIRTLQGLLPICCGCKRIRDDRGYWDEVESYLKSRSAVEFTHGICPECERRLYGEALGKGEA